MKDSTGLRNFVKNIEPLRRDDMALGYNQTMALLLEGHLVYWHGYPASKATINGKVIRYDAYRKLQDQHHLKNTPSVLGGIFELA